MGISFQYRPNPSGAPARSQPVENLGMHLDLGGSGQHGEAPQRLGSLGRRQAGDQRPDPYDVEHRLGLLYSHARRRQAQIHAAAVRLVPNPQDIAAAHEAIDRD